MPRGSSHGAANPNGPAVAVPRLQREWLARARGQRGSVRLLAGQILAGTLVEPGPHGGAPGRCRGRCQTRNQQHAGGKAAETQKKKGPAAEIRQGKKETTVKYSSIVSFRSTCAKTATVPASESTNG